MKKILIVLFILIFAQANVQAVVLPTETEVTVRPSQAIDADRVKVGDTIKFQTVEDVIDNDKIVFQRGTEVLAKVKRKRNNFILGAPGEILIGDFELLANDGSKIRLSGSVANMGTARYWIILPGIFVTPLLLIKGNDAKLPITKVVTLYSM